MKMNCLSPARGHVEVYLNGRQLEHCYEADEEAGTVWIAYRNLTGSLVDEKDAEPGAFIFQYHQVIQLKGKVEIKFQPTQGLTAEEMRTAEMESLFTPIVITRKA